MLIILLITVLVCSGAVMIKSKSFAGVLVTAVIAVCFIGAAYVADSMGILT